MTDEEIRLEALKAAVLLHSGKNTSVSSTAIAAAERFEEYIRGQE